MTQEELRNLAQSIVCWLSFRGEPFDNGQKYNFAHGEDVHLKEDNLTLNLNKNQVHFCYNNIIELKSQLGSELLESKNDNTVETGNVV